MVVVMGYQFVHIESFSRKADDKGRSTAFVLSEAERRPEASHHIANPAEPVSIFGMTLSDLRALHDTRAAAAMTTTKAGKVRKIRQDQHTLMTVVASHPVTTDEVRADPAKAAAVEEWQRRTVAWLRSWWGDRLVSVIRHDDESHPHLHAYVLPDDADLKARQLHPGVVAKADAKAMAEAEGMDARAANKIGDAAYRTAMRALQDSYFAQVGICCGLTRLGPGRRRLDRGAWRAEQAAAAAAAMALREAMQARQDAGQARDVVRGAEERAAKLQAQGQTFVRVARAAANAAATAAEEAEQRRKTQETAAAQIVAKARDQAKEIVAEAERAADRVQSAGRRLGGLWAGMRGVESRLTAKAEQRVVDAETKAASELAAATERVRKDLEAEFGSVIATLKAEAGRAAREAKTEAERARKAEAAARQAEAEAARERSGRLSAEREREDFRSRWADADNAIIALRNGC